jgi:hypothetical protein
MKVTHGKAVQNILIKLANNCNLPLQAQSTNLPRQAQSTNLPLQAQSTNKVQKSI